MRTFLVVATILILAACTSISTDPNRGGFIGGLKGVVGGEYDKRLVQQQSEVDELNALNAILKERLVETNTERTHIGLEIDKISEQLKTSQNVLDDSRTLLASEQAAKLIDEQTLFALKQEQQRLETLMLDLTLVTVQLQKEEKQFSEKTSKKNETVPPKKNALESRLKQTKSLEQQTAEDIEKHSALIDQLFAKK
ncbi:hypothetical protein CTT31_04110 [Pseudoalteromonas maricaloris]|uniref:hypothetical protein n=1 Tax=Pseudoalteromonas maricaloris TaxID=184924 RepID=UPI0021ADE496|nr:hypothetical protein [Pseudoalteromonas flavipulchra]USE68346.1 hypothetical protein CTT31_04110 [Pseudoalteromonas flavipulchra]